MGKIILHEHRSVARHYRADRARQLNVVGGKIAEARKAAGLTQAELASLLAKYGVTVQTPAVTKWEKGENVPSVYQLLAVCYALNLPGGLSYFTGTLQAESSDDPLNREGLRLLGAYRRYLESIPKYRSGDGSEIEMTELDVSLIPASAGLGDYLENNIFEKMSFPSASVPDGTDFAIRVDGDSMEPAYHDGQYVFIEQCSTLRPGEVGLFVYDGCGYIKVYTEEENESGDDGDDCYGTLYFRPILVSLNDSKYAPIPVESGKPFAVVGRVLN